MSVESNITKNFDAVLKDIKNNGRTTKSISVKSYGSNVNLRPLVTKLLNAEETVPKKDYGFDEVFHVFNEIDSKCNKLNEYKPIASNKIDRKTKMLP